jgi:dipeptidyl aminopeptidase/acylaminoacyl peptidase
VRRLDGTLLFAAPDATMPAGQATWSADGRLYYSDSRGVVAVDPSTGATRIVLPGMRWHHPDTAPDGRRIVFELRDAQGGVRLQLLDVASGQVDSGFVRGGGREARFVSSTELWFHEQDQFDAPLVAFDLLRRYERMVGMAGQLTDARVVATS